MNKSSIYIFLLCCLSALLLLLPSLAMGEEIDSYCEDEIIETYTYDPGGKLISSIDRNGNETKFDYDVFGKVVKTEFADGSITDYAYDSAGRLTEVYDTAGGFIYFGYYSNFDRVIKETTPNGSVSYTYDMLGRRVSMTVSGQEMVYYVYDEDSRLINITSGDLSFGFEYDAIGRRTALSYPNGQTTNYSYDNASNLLSLEHVNSSNSTIAKIAYAYDKNGNRTKIDRQNVSPMSSQPMTSSYDNANRMITFNTENLLYDDNGNLIQKGDTSYQWDVRGRLVGMSSPTLSASFKYDALGRRIEKTINGKTTQYLYDGLDIVQEIENGMVTVNYVRTLNIDEPLAMINKDGVYFYIYDGLGSVVGLTDSSGQEVVHYSYDTFGNTSSSNASFVNPFQFTGRENDRTGLYFYRARYYSPELHRFTSEDPIGLAGGTNKYSYVGNQPTRYSDPTGLKESIALSFLKKTVGSVIATNGTYGMIGSAVLGAFGTYYGGVFGGIGGSMLGGAIFGKLDPQGAGELNSNEAVPQIQPSIGMPHSGTEQNYNESFPKMPPSIGMPHPNSPIPPSIGMPHTDSLSPSTPVGKQRCR